MFMKTKSLLLAFAGLGLFACTNEDVNGVADGNANVTVTINQAVLGSRASQDHIADGTAVDVKTMNVVLTAGGTHVRDLQNVTSPKEIVFTNVGIPTAMRVSVNGGDEELALTNEIINGGKAAPMLCTASGNANSEDETNKIYKVDDTNYTISATPEFQVARLELSGIKYKTTGLTEGTTAAYSDVKLMGVYVNGVLNSINGDPCKVEGTSAWTSMVGNTFGPESGNLQIYDKINGDAGVAIDGGTAYPTDTKVIAYNFIPSETAEQVVLVLSAKAYGEEDAKTYYAAVEKYKVNGTGIAIDKFAVGNVYSITNLEFTDEAITPDPDGPKNVTVTATVTIKTWQEVNTDVEWK